MKKHLNVDAGHVAVIGAGLMGHAIAQVFAAQGFSVSLTDVAPDAVSKALNMIRSNLGAMTGAGLFKEEDIEPVLHRITEARDLEEAADGACLVIEAVFENLPLKQDVFRELDALCGEDTVLATNTSVISITEIAARCQHPDRVLGTHFWNPAHLIPLVEVVRGDHTADWAMDQIFATMEKIGKRPVRVNRDVPGFVGNRLQQALWREAISIVEQGIAEPATVDECVKYGFGLRLPILGPMENMDMVGTDLALAIHDYILKHLEASPNPSPLLQSLVDAGNTGFKSGTGFQDWSPEAAEASRKRLADYLLHRTT